MASTTTGVPLVNLDDTLSNGVTYTFQFQSENYVINPSNETLTADIQGSAPDFLTSLQVSTPSLSFTTGETSFFKTLYNVQFTYEGDNSDIVSDVSSSIVASVLAGSNDNISFVGGVRSGNSSLIATPSAVGNAALNAGKTAVNDLTGAATDAAQKAISESLKAILPVLIIVVALVLFVLPSFVTSATRLEGR